HPRRACHTSACHLLLSLVYTLYLSTSLLFFLFFFLLLRRPPRSTLFPYTTALPISTSPTAVSRSGRWDAMPTSSERRPRVLVTRSEEHTSELQSLRHLVCRLLLEKKKKKKTTSIVASQIT